MTGTRDSPGLSLGASEGAIREHYDAGNEFYLAWLDPSMTYSAARWSANGARALTLEEAQERKLDWHLDAATVGRGSRLLDVGCGWGSLLVRAVRDRGAAEAIGLTPARRQRDWICSRLDEAGVEVHCSVWQEAHIGTGFDAVISLGALEHFAKPGLSVNEKIRSYERFFEFCRNAVSDNGRVSIQFIGWMDVRPNAECSYLPTELFPESNLPRLAEVIAAADRTFHPLYLENVPDDYVLTIRAWLGRLNGARDGLVREHGRDLVKTYIRAFRRFVLGFEAGSLGLYRLVLRPRGFRS
jgi:cyclopropane-fatty-acyl-phospholipid synthase